MPHKLRKLTITRVAVCRQGANYDPDTGEGAHILLFKSADPAVEKQDATVGDVYTDTFATASACTDPTCDDPHCPVHGGMVRARRKKKKRLAKFDEPMGLHGEPDGDEATPLSYAQRGQQYDFWEALWEKWQCFCETFYDVIGDSDEDNVPHLPILVESIGQFQTDVESLLVPLGLTAKMAKGLWDLSQVCKAGAAMADHRRKRLRDAIAALQQILEECTPDVIDRPGVSAADIYGMPHVMKGRHAMALRKNTESDKEHCDNCDDTDCDNPAHDRMEKAEEAVVSGNAAQFQIDELTKRAEAAEARAKDLDAQLAKSAADLAAVQEDQRIAKMTPEEQHEAMLATMPALIRKNYLDQQSRLELIEKANKDLQEKNERLDYIQKAVVYRPMGFVPDDHWEILKAIDQMPEGPRTELTRLLKSATELLKTSPWTTTVGSTVPSHAGTDGSAQQQILALATAHQAEKGGSLGDAIGVIAKAHPELWEQDQQEKRFKNRVETR
jgi:hypothetical protein